MEVSIHELRTITNLLLDRLLEEGHQKVILPHDYYWSVPKDVESDPYEQPTSLTLGQLSEDINQLRSLLSGEKEPLAYALVWLASILRAVGKEVVA